MYVCNHADLQDGCLSSSTRHTSHRMQTQAVYSECCWFQECCRISEVDIPRQWKRKDLLKCIWMQNPATVSCLHSRALPGMLQRSRTRWCTFFPRPVDIFCISCSIITTRRRGPYTRRRITLWHTRIKVRFQLGRQWSGCWCEQP